MNQHYFANNVLKLTAGLGILAMVLPTFFVHVWEDVETHKPSHLFNPC